MPAFLVSDIFGRTPALETICDTLSQAAPGMQIIDPYNGVYHKFETEALAYGYFMDRVGLNKYQSILADQLTPCPLNTILIGFSVGASAIWGISHTPSLKHVQKAFCFYGSQIRHQAGMLPCFDMELIFPKNESHFDVDTLIERLNKKNNVTCTKASGLHGFMNAVSSRFDPACCADFIRYLNDALIQLKS